MSADALYNEPQLLQRLYTGDEVAFTQLYRHYSETLYYATLALVKDEYLAEEFVQQAFANIWQKRSTLDIQGNFSGYLYRVSQNLVYDFFRKLKRDRARYQRFAEMSCQQYSDIEEALYRKENLAFLEKLVAALPEQRRRVFRLVRLEGCSYKEAARLLQISPATVRDHLVKATRFMEQQAKDLPGEHLLAVFFFLYFLR